MATDESRTPAGAPVLSESQQAAIMRLQKDENVIPAPVWLSRQAPMANDNIERAWAAADPLAAMTWIEDLTDPAVRQDAELGLTQTLSEQPPNRQQEWLRLAPPGLRPRLEPSNTTAD